MKRLYVCMALGLLSLAARAQSDTEMSSVTIPSARLQIEVPATAHRGMRGVFDEFKGAYDLSNGNVLSLTQQGRRIYADAGTGDKKEIVAIRHNVFVAFDASMKITLEEQANGDVTGELLLRVPAATPTAANATTVSVSTFASR